jgi:hypothetical protein
MDMDMCTNPYSMRIGNEGWVKCTACGAELHDIDFTNDLPNHERPNDINTTHTLTAEDIDQAYRDGADAALSVVSWCEMSDQVAAYLIADDDIDPALEDMLPAEPNLSGEYADSPTPHSLASDITMHPWAELDASVIDALSDAWEEGRDAVWRRALRAVAYRHAGDIGAALGLERQNDRVAHDGKAKRVDLPHHDDAKSYRAFIYGELVAMAAPVVKSYWSDLYHDTTWLNDHVSPTAPATFYFACDDCGTAIGTDRDLVTLYRSTSHAYRVTTSVDTLGRHFARFLPLDIDS